MLQTKDLKTVAYAGAAAPYDGEFFAQPITKIGFKLDGAVTAAGGGAVAGLKDDAAHRLAGTPEVAQAGETLIRMAAQDWKHLEAIVSGGYSKRREETPGAGLTGKFMADASLDLARMLPGAMIDSRSERLVLSGNFNSDASYATTNVSAMTGTMRPRVGAIDVTPGGSYWRPRFVQKAVRIENPSDLDNTIFQHPREVFILGYLFRQYDSTADARVDGILRKIRADFTQPGVQTRTLISTTWGAMRQETARRAAWGVADVDESEGVAMLGFADPTHGVRGLTAPAGSSMTIWLDSQSAIEGEFDAVVAAAGDQLIVTEIAFERVAGTAARIGGATPTTRGTRGGSLRR